MYSLTESISNVAALTIAANASVAIISFAFVPIFLHFVSVASAQTLMSIVICHPITQIILIRHCDHSVAVVIVLIFTLKLNQFGRKT